MSIWKNNLLTGFITGLLVPPLAFVLFCYFSLPDETIGEVVRRYYKLNVITHVISLSVLVNLAVFFLFLKTDKERSAQGVIGSTFFYVLLVLILKLI